MGPLAPNEIITGNTNFLMAFLIGIGFGFVLEATGFSSSRKMAGVFYGYDTVVLKVFFTGAITAMLGLLFLSLFGWIDLNLVYINPTYLNSSILGGIIMGVGFIMSGYCPGVSISAISIGKIDAMIFLVGIFLGIFFFAEGYPIWEDFYKANYLGIPKLNEVLGISGGVLALLVVLAAFGMFWVAEKAEKTFPRDEY